MTRILHILDHSLPMHSGYSFRTRAIMKAQAALGWEVVGVTGQRHTAPDTGRGRDIEDGLEFFRSRGSADGPPGLREWREIARYARRIEAVVDNWKPDILHAHSPALNGMAALRAARATGLPLVYEIRAFWEDAAVGNGTGREGNLRYKLTRALENRVIAGADAVVTICQGLKDDLLARGVAEQRISISPNGVDMAMFGAPVSRDTALAQQLGMGDGPVIGYIGSFYDYEGLDDLIAAMPLITAQHPQAKLLLVGGGPCEAALKAQAQTSSAAQAIHFMGRVPHDEVDRYYSLVDVLAYPRKAMRLTDLVTPLKPLEAMAQGKLVAASSVGGHRELINDGATGTLFAPDDPAALAQAVSALLGDRMMWDQRRHTARNFVENERNWAVNVQRYQAVYQTVLAMRQRSSMNGPANLAA